MLELILIIILNLGYNTDPSSTINSTTDNVQSENVITDHDKPEK